MNGPIEHEINLTLDSGADLKILYFSDQEQRWIHTYRYRGLRVPGADPDVVNDVRLTAEYEAGYLANSFVLSMHLIIPSRLGREFFAGVDISPGAKTYLEFNYERIDHEYRLTEICKGARERVRIDPDKPGLIQPIQFPFPVLDRLPIPHTRVEVPFLTDEGQVANFELPSHTLRGDFT